MTDLTHEPRTLSATRGRWLLVAAAVLWSTTGLFVKFDALRTVDGPTLACLRSLFAALCLLPFLKLESVRWQRGLVPMAVSFAIVIVSLRHLRDLSPVFLVLVNQLAACLVLLPWLAWHPPELSLQQWTLLAAFGVVPMAVPYLLFARGVKSVPVQEAALIVLLEPVLTPAWVGLLGWESAPATVWLGGGLIVTGLLLRYTLFAKDSPNDRTPIGDI